MNDKQVKISIYLAALFLEKLNSKPSIHSMNFWKCALAVNKTTLVYRT